MAFQLAVDLRRVIAPWQTFDLWSIGVQLVRAAGSIGANIAEAEGRWHPSDRVRFLLYARGSLHETEHWLEVAAETGLLQRASYEDRLKELGRTLNGLIRSTRPR
jgi:four helix bundle protein